MLPLVDVMFGSLERGSTHGIGPSVVPEFFLVLVGSFFPSHSAARHQESKNCIHGDRKVFLDPILKTEIMVQYIFQRLRKIRVTRNELSPSLQNIYVSLIFFGLGTPRMISDMMKHSMRSEDAPIA